jgi:hypothetical protein
MQQPVLAVVGAVSELPLHEGHQLVCSWFKQAQQLEIAAGNHKNRTD